MPLKRPIHAHMLVLLGQALSALMCANRLKANNGREY